MHMPVLCFGMYNVTQCMSHCAYVPWQANHLADFRLHSFHGPILPLFVYATLEIIGILKPNRVLQCFDTVGWVM